MGKLKALLSDTKGLAAVLGPVKSLRWLLSVVFRLPAILRQRNLQEADRAMGDGPFEIRYQNNIEFQIEGPSALSGIREMYVRDTYLHGGILTIDDGDVVVDLGSNMGNFSSLALAHGPNVSVIAVEPSSILNRIMWTSLALNPGFSQRVSLVRAFLGAPNEKQASLDSDPAYAGVPWVDESAFLVQARITRIDFLKCDIEGGEFGLLTPASRILKMARKLAIEIHSFAGDVDMFIAMLEFQGFNVLHTQCDPDGTKTVLASRI